MKKQKKDIKKIQDIQGEGKMTKEVRDNHWVLSTIILGIVCLAFLVVSFVDNFNPVTEGNSLDNFAQCLTDSGAKMYGTEGCGYCNNKKNFSEVHLKRLII